MQVADTIRYLSYSDFYGQYALGREHFQALPEEVRAVRCGDCARMRHPVPERRARAGAARSGRRNCSPRISPGVRTLRGRYRS